MTITVSFAVKRSNRLLSRVFKASNPLTPKFAWLAIGETNQVGISNREHTGHLPKVETLSKFGLRCVDCKMVIHVLGAKS
jgi:hypothetical protein